MCRDTWTPVCVSKAQTRLGTHTHPQMDARTRAAFECIGTKDSAAVLRELLGEGLDANACLTTDTGLVFNLISIACIRDDCAAVEVLANGGVDLNEFMKFHEEGETPLTYSLFMKRDSMVDTLLLLDTDVNRTDNHGESPLMYAVSNGDLARVQQLVELGADVNHCSDFDNTPLDLARDKGVQSVVDFLVQRGAVVEDEPME